MPLNIANKNRKNKRVTAIGGVPIDQYQGSSQDEGEAGVLGKAARQGVPARAVGSKAEVEAAREAQNQRLQAEDVSLQQAAAQALQDAVGKVDVSSQLVEAQQQAEQDVQFQNMLANPGIVPTGTINQAPSTLPTGQVPTVLDESSLGARTALRANSIASGAAKGAGLGAVAGSFVPPLLPAFIAGGALLGATGSIGTVLTLERTDNVDQAYSKFNTAKTAIGDIINSVNADPTYTKEQAIADFQKAVTTVIIAEQDIQAQRDSFLGTVTAKNSFEKLTEIQTWKDTTLRTLRVDLANALNNPDPLAKAVYPRLQQQATNDNQEETNI